MARTPSHLISNSQSSPCGGRSPIDAFIGSIVSGISAALAPLIFDASTFDFFRAGAALLAAAVFAARFAGRLLSHTRSDAPAVVRLLSRAGRLRAISSCVRPESTLYACASTSHPGDADS